MGEKSFNICVLPGDGIGPEVMDQALRVLRVIEKKYDVHFNFEESLIGGCAIDTYGTALPDETLICAREADAVMLGAVGGPQWDTVDAGKPRPEDGLLGIRKELGLFANLRPITIYDALISSSPLRPEKVEGADILIVRELTGGLYFGEHKTQENVEDAGGPGKAGLHAHDVMIYDEFEIERIARIAFEAAIKRRKKVTSVDKANVLDTGMLWRKVVGQIATEYPGIEVNDMLVDNCAMQIILNPAQFDVLLTENTFGDILSDEASVLAGSLGLLPSASLGTCTSLFEPCHGSAPDIAGKNVANPIAQIKSAAMMLEYAFELDAAAQDIENSVQMVLDEGWRTKDIAVPSTPEKCILGTREMGEKIAAHIEEDR